jgi:signal transduction histidine kinase/DNA-binding response OmpR family regulator
MKILSVDDQNDNLYLMQSMLGDKHTIYDAKNGREALKILERKKVDIIISDILMPVMDGFALCQEIRRNQDYNSIPFIFYTATYTGAQDEELARQMGADDFIIKPCAADEFLRRIERVLEISKEIEPKRSTGEMNNETVLKLYNERLVRKLEQKMLELETQIQERENTMEALKRNEELLKETQSLGKLGGWEYNLKTKEMYWTDEMYILHDIDPMSTSRQELVEVSISGYPPESRMLLEEHMKRIAQDGVPYQLETWYTTRKGNKRYIRATAKAIIEDNEIAKVIGTFQDITEQKEAEIKQKELQEQLRQAQKLDSIGHLAGGVAHDFNNILTVILGYSEEIINNLHEQDPLRNEIQEIINAGQRASSLTRQLLTFSRKQVIKPELININEVIKNLSKMLMRLIGEDVDFILNLAEDVPPVMADVGQMEQVIMNLVINAREAMQMGGVLTISTFGYKADEAFVARHPMISGEHFAVLKVQDTGCGMTKDTLEHIFEPFFTTKAKGHGTGLGLPTVYGIIRQTGGNIHVESSPGKGASFVIMIPASGEAETRKETILAQDNIPGNKELVLIVEDDPSISDLSGKFITKMGYRVVLTESADKALNLIEDEGLRPKLVITDVVMPGLSGLELAAILRFKHPDMRIILMSGYTETVISKHGERDSSIPFLHKPFTRQELLQKMELALK